MNIRKYIMNGISGLLLFVAGCSEAPIGQTPVNKTPPSPLSNVQVESLPGGGKFTYDLPNEKDISYVKAEYVYKGIPYTVRSSIYNNYLIVEGLGDTNPLEVSLKVVNHSEVASTAVSTTLTPDIPAVLTIFETVDFDATFGGIAVWWQNDSGTEIGVRIYVKEEGEMRLFNTAFSKFVDGFYLFHGLEPEENNFAIQIVDKWGNESGVKEKILTPFLEEEFKKNLFSALELPGDDNTSSGARLFSNMWDGDIYSIWHSGGGAIEGLEWPKFVTLDLGIDAVLSRMRIWARPDFWYANFTWKTFEVWGAKEYRPDMSVEYWHGSEWENDGWVQLADYEVLRPSGNPDPVNIPGGEDLAFAQEGFEITFDVVETIRYVRFKVKSIWATGNAQHMGELSIWGGPR